LNAKFGAVADPVTHLIEELERLPGIGRKSAQRLAYYLLRVPEEQARALAGAIVEIKERIRFCSTCFNITEDDPCLLCADPVRDRSKVCVVEEPLDILALESTHRYKGLYHVLHGALSPIQGIGPEDLKLRELIGRLDAGGVVEVIMATNPNTEGDYTASYIYRQIERPGLRITRIARGLPLGGDLGYADEATLSDALDHRREF
jgi:recombination protein RecR